MSERRYRSPPRRKAHQSIPVAPTNSTIPPPTPRSTGDDYGRRHGSGRRVEEHAVPALDLSFAQLHLHQKGHHYPDDDDHDLPTSSVVTTMRNLFAHTYQVFQATICKPLSTPRHQQDGGPQHRQVPPTPRPSQPLRPSVCGLPRGTMNPPSRTPSPLNLDGITVRAPPSSPSQDRDDFRSTVTSPSPPPRRHALIPELQLNSITAEHRRAHTEENCGIVAEERNQRKRSRYDDDDDEPTHSARSSTSECAARPVVPVTPRAAVPELPHLQEALRKLRQQSGRVEHRTFSNPVRAGWEERRGGDNADIGSGVARVEPVLYPRTQRSSVTFAVDTTFIVHQRMISSKGSPRSPRSPRSPSQRDATGAQGITAMCRLGVHAATGPTTVPRLNIPIGREEDRSLSKFDPATGAPTATPNEVHRDTEPEVMRTRGGRAAFDAAPLVSKPLREFTGSTTPRIPTTRGLRARGEQDQLNGPHLAPAALMVKPQEDVFFPFHFPEVPRPRPVFLFDKPYDASSQ